MIKKRAQVWIETVTYTLIAFVMIGLVLSFAKPKIEEMQDKSVIEQSIKIMKEIDSVILEVNEEGIGNKRKVEMGIKKGSFYINSSEDKVYFELNGRSMFSEPGESYIEGNLKITTLEYGTQYKVILERDYSEDYNLTYSGEEKPKIVVPSQSYYELFISNKGGSPRNIDFLIN